MLSKWLRPANDWLNRRVVVHHHIHSPRLKVVARHHIHVLGFITVGLHHIHQLTAIASYHHSHMPALKSSCTPPHACAQLGGFVVVRSNRINQPSCEVVVYHHIRTPALKLVAHHHIEQLSRDWSHTTTSVYPAPLWLNNTTSISSATLGTAYRHTIARWLDAATFQVYLLDAQDTKLVLHAEYTKTVP
ncbi:hypothetical protein NMY22_g2494 [Coprinellus aureogranulatus]|nr:hypothetical protein NMY22_g2494 [Coprinellus aureogranulatus]